MNSKTLKKRVELSAYSMVLSILSTVLLCGIFIYILKQPDNLWAVCILGIMIIILFLSTLLFMPLSVSVDSESLNVNCPFKVKSIPLSDILEIRLCSPTMGEKRIFGSGGWFGYYGWFSEKDLGKYFAYYGKASDCFLVTLKNGKKYMLGCNDPAEIVETVSNRIRG